MTIVSGLTRYFRVWSKYFEPFNTLNFGSPGDYAENVLWRVQHGELPDKLKIAVIHVGTNNADKQNVEDIVSELSELLAAFLTKSPGQT